MLTVPEVATRLGLDPETVLRWIRSGMLPAQRIGTQHLIDERDLQPFEGEGRGWIPQEWRTFPDGRAQPNWERIVRSQRESH